MILEHFVYTMKANVAITKKKRKKPLIIYVFSLLEQAMILEHFVYTMKANVDYLRFFFVKATLAFIVYSKCSKTIA